MESFLKSRLQGVITNLIISEPFYGLISRYFHLHYDANFAFLGGVKAAYPYILFVFGNKINDLNDDELTTLIKHECLHFALGHLAVPNWTQLDNEAADLSINSHLCKEHIIAMNGLMPGHGIYKSMPPEKSMEHYKRLLTKEGLAPTQGFDDHSDFGNHDKDEEGYSSPKEFIKQIMGDVVGELNSSNRWGNIPKELKQDIEEFVFGKYDWGKHLRNIVCRVRSNKIMFSRKRRNKRFPNMFPGMIRQYRSRIMVGVDESGSVDHTMWSNFMSKLASLNTYADFVFVPFDCEVNESNVFDVVDGARFSVSRSLNGGTDFNSITKYFNENNYDALFILTDGAAPAPLACKSQRVWVLPQSCKLSFETHEKIIYLN